MPWKFYLANVHRGSWPLRGTGINFDGPGMLGDDTIATLDVPVRPGKIYIFSSWIDSASISARSAALRAISGPTPAFDLLTLSSDEKRIYSAGFWPLGPASRYRTVPWRCPVGVSHIKVVIGTGFDHRSIVAGQGIYFSQLTLTEITPAIPTVGANRTKATPADWHKTSSVEFLLEDPPLHRNV
jgi:hypothetical protein